MASGYRDRSSHAVVHLCSIHSFSTLLLVRAYQEAILVRTVTELERHRGMSRGRTRKCGARVAGERSKKEPEDRRACKLITICIVMMTTDHGLTRLIRFDSRYPATENRTGTARYRTLLSSLSRVTESVESRRDVSRLSLLDLGLVESR